MKRTKVFVISVSIYSCYVCLRAVTFSPGRRERDWQKFRDETERFWKDYDWEFEERFARQRANRERIEREHESRRRAYDRERATRHTDDAPDEADVRFPPPGRRPASRPPAAC